MIPNIYILCVSLVTDMIWKIYFLKQRILIVGKIYKNSFFPRNLKQYKTYWFFRKKNETTTIEQ